MAGRHKRMRQVPAVSRTGHGHSVRHGVTAQNRIFIQAAGGIILRLTDEAAARLAYGLIDDVDFARRARNTPSPGPRS